MRRAWTTLTNRGAECENVYTTVMGRLLQTKMRLCDPMGSPPTRVVSPSFPVASAREVPPRED